MRNRPLYMTMATLTALTVIVVPAGPAAAALDLVRVVAWTPSDDSDEKGVTAHCPPDTKVIGGGADVVGGGNNIHITGMRHAGNTTAFTANAVEHDPTNLDWQLKVHAVCAPEPEGLIYVWEPSVWDSAYSHSATAYCPPGTKVLGWGAIVGGEDPSKIFLTIVKPTGTGNGAEAAGVEMQGGNSGDWFISVWAICAEQPVGWAVTSAPGNGVGFAAFTCPGGKKLTASGAYISLSLGKIFLRDVVVSHANGDTSVPVGSSVTTGWVDSGYTHDWSMKAFGVCVT